MRDKDAGRFGRNATRLIGIFKLLELQVFEGARGNPTTTSVYSHRGAFNATTAAR